MGGWSCAACHAFWYAVRSLSLRLARWSISSKLEGIGRVPLSQLPHVLVEIPNASACADWVFFPVCVPSFCKSTIRCLCSSDKSFVGSFALPMRPVPSHQTSTNQQV